MRLTLIAAAAFAVAPLASADLNVPGDHATIQAAIDAIGPGETIFVAPGTYVETLLVDPGGVYGAATGQTSFSIVATGPGVVVEWPALATRQAAYNPAIVTTSGKQVDAILAVNGTTGFLVEGITFDGLSDMDPSTGSVTSCGVFFIDAVGRVVDCEITGVEISPTSGAQGGI